MNMENYDLVVIGSGVGLTIIEEALQNGMRCAIVEKGKFGGTCLNRGCIPSKVLVYPADLIREAEHADKTGVSYSPPEVSWPTIARRMWQFIDKNKKIEAGLLSAGHLTVYRGTGVFTGPDVLQVADEQDGRTAPFTARLFVLAPGVRTQIPQIEGLSETGFVTSESFFGPLFPEKPWKSLTIIGGGAIGLEFAHIFSAQGTQVTIVEMATRLAPTEEPEISSLLEGQFRRHGISVHTGCQAVSAEKADSGDKCLLIRNRSDATTQSICSEELFVASGVRSNADLLQVDKAGIATDARGYIITNEYLETNRKNVWALGDINGKYQFRHKANYEAEILVHNLFRPDLSKRSANYQSVPWAIFTDPQIAHVGLREDEIKASGIRYLVGVNHYSDIAKGYAMGYEHTDPDNGFVKLLTDENMKILGVHLVGPQASVLIQSFVYLMNAGYKCTQKSRSKRKGAGQRAIPGLFPPCTEAGSLDPIVHSMVIHPALSELTAWVIDNLEWADGS
jgi:dihydrolipoamide dehydrogenase